jgi:spore coat protein SA
MTENRQPQTIEQARPTVALIAPELYPVPPIRGGGAELFIDQVAGSLTAWRPVVIGVSDPDLPLRERRGRVEYLRIPLSGWRKRLYCRYRQYFPIYDREIARLLLGLKPQVVHVHNRPLLAHSLKRRLGGVPVILHMHNLYNSLGKRERPAPGASLPLEGFVACSRFVLERERSRLGLGVALHRVVYNGVDPAAFSSLWDEGKSASEVRRQHHLADEPTVLFAGKLREAKGVHILLAAMERVWQSLPQAVLVLVGGT